LVLGSLLLLGAFTLSIIFLCDLISEEKIVSPKI
jgi:hypothetical protein